MQFANNNSPSLDIANANQPLSNTVVRFAPSPTGYLHIGGARTALFNYVFARAKGGKFLLRIEDTDENREKEGATQVILDGLKWLGITHDGEVVFQSQRYERHRNVAYDLVAKGYAYACDCTKEEIQAERDRCTAQKITYRYSGKCRDKNLKLGSMPLRIRSSGVGEIKIHDIIAGDILGTADNIDDMIILRADQRPVYMFCVVVDDHDMGITHVIRGNDHLTNTFRQCMIYDICAFERPQFCHLPLIHASDGTKLSKRHGAVSVMSYKDKGYLPESICFYLMHLGWSPQKFGVKSLQESFSYFDLADLSCAPARFDLAKLDSINQDLIAKSSDEDLSGHMCDLRRGNHTWTEYVIKMRPAFNLVRGRSKTLLEIAEDLRFMYETVALSPSDQDIVKDNNHLMNEALIALDRADLSNKSGVTDYIEWLARETGASKSVLMKMIKIMITGRSDYLSLSDVLCSISKDQLTQRISKFIAQNSLVV